MDKEYEKIKEEYVLISSETRNKMTALCVTVIAGIYFFYEKEIGNIPLLKIALLFYVVTILIEIIAGFLKSQHYSLWFDRKIENIDYRNSKYGRWSEILFWVPIFSFIIGSIFFFKGILF